MGCSLRQRLHCKCQQTVTFDRRHNLKNWILPFRGRMRKEEFRFELALWPTIATPKSRAVEAEITIRNRHLAGISLGCAEGDVAQRKPQFRRRAQISRYTHTYTHTPTHTHTHTHTHNVPPPLPSPFDAGYLRLKPWCLGRVDGAGEVHRHQHSAQFTWVGFPAHTDQTGGHLLLVLVHLLLLQTPGHNR